MSEKPQRVTVKTLQNKKRKGERFTMLTAYDYHTAKMLDEAKVDCILVGDSLGMVVQGKSTTIPVTIEEMIYHGEMVARATDRAMVVVDLPFPVGQLSIVHTVEVAATIMKRTQCQAVKMEGGHQQAASIRALVDAGIPTIAHIGLRPQSVHALGGYRVQRDVDQLMMDARAAEQSGAFSVLMECVPPELAKQVTEQLSIPTIGIGAGPDCDAQVLVTNDMLGWNSGYVPKFVRTYANLRDASVKAVVQYCEDVLSGKFPNADESF